MNAAQEIKDSVTVPQALLHYGFETSRVGRIPCPIHDGKDRNFSYNELRFHCFVCGAGGSVIDLVMGLFHLTYAQALVRLDEDFHLELLRGKSDPVIRRQIEEAARKQAHKRRMRAIEKNLYQEEINARCAEFRALWQGAEEPPGWDGQGAPPPLPQSYVQAAHRLDYLNYWLEVNDTFEGWEANRNGGDTNPGVYAGRVSGGDCSL